MGLACVVVILSNTSSRRQCRLPCALLLVAVVSAAACKEEGTVAVKSLTFNGVHAVDESRLRNALATRTSAKLPWGKKAYFDRARFDADLKRLQAFYADRGYPDARVTDFDVKLNDKQDAVDVTVTIDEGAAGATVAAIDFAASTRCRADHLDRPEDAACRSRSSKPRDRQDWSSHARTGRQRAAATTAIRTRKVSTTEEDADGDGEATRR